MNKERRTVSRRSPARNGSSLVSLLTLVVLLVSVNCATASADGIDVVWFMTRAGGWSVHPVLSVAIMVSLMLVNYILNLVVIGIPTAKILQVRLRALLRDLATFTLLAQIADRIAAIGALILSVVAMHLFSVGGEQGVTHAVIASIGLNFVFSGLVVGLLALWYTKRRWGLVGRPRSVVALRAGLITNPAWIMVLWVIST